GFNLVGIPLFAVRETPSWGKTRALKRGNHIVFATILLLMSWPLVLALSIGVRMSSPGPALFRQRRYGLYGESIYVYKFRTMRVCEDGKVTQAQRNAPSVTPFGGLLPRTSL